MKTREDIQAIIDVKGWPKIESEILLDIRDLLMKIAGVTVEPVEPVEPTQPTEAPVEAPVEVPADVPVTPTE